MAPVTNITLDLERHLAEQVSSALTNSYQTQLVCFFFGFKHTSAIFGSLTQANSDGNSTDFLLTQDFGIIYSKRSVLIQPKS